MRHPLASAVRPNPSLRRAFRFFLNHAGYCVGRRAAGALSLARAERDARDEGLTFVWEDDPEGWQDVRADGETVSTCEVCTCYDESGNVLDSLGAIWDASDAYRRVVQAEVALGALSALADREGAAVRPL